MFRTCYLCTCDDNCACWSGTKFHLPCLCIFPTTTPLRGILRTRHILSYMPHPAAAGRACATSPTLSHYSRSQTHQFSPSCPPCFPRGTPRRAEPPSILQCAVGSLNHARGSSLIFPGVSLNLSSIPACAGVESNGLAAPQFRNILLCDPTDLGGPSPCRAHESKTLLQPP